MIQVGTNLIAADNTGAKRLRCIHVYGGSRRRYARLGDIILATVKESVPYGMVKKGEMVQCVIVRQKKEFGRKDGSYIRFDENAVVVLEKGAKDPKGSRVFGPIAREVKQRGFDKIASHAPEVL